MQQFLAQQVVIQIDLMKSQNFQNKGNKSVYNKLKILEYKNESHNTLFETDQLYLAASEFAGAVN